MTLLVRLLGWPCSVAAYLVAPSRAPAPESSTITRLRGHMTLLEQRGARFRAEARNHEHALISYHMSRRSDRAMRALNIGERERVRSLLERRQRRLADSIRSERMALVLDRAISTLASTACVHDVAQSLRAASVHNKRLISALESSTLNVAELMDALNDDEDVAASYAAALSHVDSVRALDGEDIDMQLEELIVAETTSNEQLDRVARTIVAPEPVRRREPVKILA